MTQQQYCPSWTQPNYKEQMFDGVKKKCILVEITGDDYRACELASRGENFWANSKVGAYGAGLCATEDDQYKPARVGLLGQMAYAKVFNLPVDLVYRKGGDKQDNLLTDNRGKTYKVDVKCAMNAGRKDQLIYHTNEWGKRIPLDKDIYVLSRIQSEDRAAEKAEVLLIGFVLNKDVSDCDVKPGRKGNGHLNYEVPFTKARPIANLLKAKEKYCI